MRHLSKDLLQQALSRSLMNYKWKTREQSWSRRRFEAGAEAAKFAVEDDVVRDRSGARLGQTRPD